jgi:hypothetical protein
MADIRGQGSESEKLRDHPPVSHLEGFRDVLRVNLLLYGARAKFPYLHWGKWTPRPGRFADRQQELLEFSA